MTTINVDMLANICTVIFLLTFTIAEAQKLRDCRRGLICIDRNNCGTYLELLKSGRSEDRTRFTRSNICQIDSNKIWVCCQNENGFKGPTLPTPIVTPATVPTIDTGAVDDGSVLPKSCGNSFISNKIIEGEVAQIGEFPWMAVIGYKEPRNPKLQFECGGSIINSRYILTAAHCVERSAGRRKVPVIVRLGEWDLRSNPDCPDALFSHQCAPPHIDAGIEEITMHPQFSSRFLYSDDIALIRLNVTLDFQSFDSPVEPICLPEMNLNVRTAAMGQDPVVTGWGLTEHNRQSSLLLSATISLANDSVCQERHRTIFGDKQLCTIGRTRTGSCAGDSGGPLIISGIRGPPFLQIGIVSFGPQPCNNDEIPSVYTSVSKYRDWILSAMKP